MILNKKSKTYIIAEAGVNHNGSFTLAKKLIEQAKRCRVDAIKFQIFKAENIALKNTKMADYQIRNLKQNISQYKMLNKLELEPHHFLELKKVAKKNKIDFLVSVFDEKSLFFFEKKIKSKVIKIPSGEITNYFLLKRLNLNKYKIILSTGMSNLKEIKDAINLIANHEVYKFKNGKIFIKDKKKFNFIKNKIFLLHCISDYPTEEKYLNLRCIQTLEKQFNLKIGFSDHTSGIDCSSISVALGAQIIEKHFTLDNKMRGPDHSSSLSPKNLKKFVNRIRQTEIVLGNHIKKAQKCEYANMRDIRKSITFKLDVKKNQIIKEDSLTAKRPGNGISPMMVKRYVNKKSKRSYKKDDLLK